MASRTQKTSPSVRLSRPVSCTMLYYIYIIVNIQNTNTIMDYDEEEGAQP